MRRHHAFALAPVGFDTINMHRPAMKLKWLQMPKYLVRVVYAARYRPLSARNTNTRSNMASM